MQREIVKAYEDGKTIKSIAKIFGVADGTVWNVLTKSNCKKHTRGDRRLFDVDTAIKYREKGYSFRRIARILGVHHSGIYRKIRIAKEKSDCQEQSKVA